MRNSLDKAVEKPTNTLCKSNTTTFIICEVTCFDLNYRSSSGILTIEFINVVHVGIDHVYVNKKLKSLCHSIYNLEWIMLSE